MEQQQQQDDFFDDVTKGLELEPITMEFEMGSLVITLKLKGCNEKLLKLPRLVWLRLEGTTMELYSSDDI